MPSGITGRDGFLPALVKSIRRSFPCRHPTTGGSLKGSPAGTPLTHRFLYYSYSTTAAAVCQPSFCPGPQPSGRRDGPSGEFARNVGLSNRVGLCVLVGVAVGPSGLAGKGRHTSIPALLPEIDVRPALVVFSAGAADAVFLCVLH